MDIAVPEDTTEFFRKVWKILGVNSIQKSELIYKISLKMNLSLKPTQVVKKIKEGIAMGVIIEKDRFLSLKEEDQEKINMEQIARRQQFQKANKDSWNRIEESKDPWMDIPEKKTQQKDKRSLAVISLVKRLLPKEIIIKGMELAAAQFHTEIQDNKISGTIDDDSEYRFEINFLNKTVIHNCADFIETTSEKTLCRHFYRIFMYVKHKDEDFAKDVLISLLTNKEEWTFK